MPTTTLDQTYRQREAAADDDVVADETSDLDEEGDEKSTESNLEAKLDSLLRELSLTGRPLPGKPGVEVAPGRAVALEDDELFAGIDRLAIAGWLRHGQSDALNAGLHRAKIIAAARRLGLRPEVEGPVTLDDLFDAFDKGASDADDSELGGSERKAVLRKFVAAAAMPGSTPLADLFGDRDTLAALKGAYLSSITDPAVRARHDRMIEATTADAERCIANFEPRITFSSRLSDLMRERGLSVRALSLRVGSYETRMAAWLRGSQPRLDQHELVARLEQELQVPGGTLLNLIAAPRVRISTDEIYTPEIRRAFKAVDVPADILPEDFHSRPENERQEILDWIFENVVGATLYSRYQRALKQDGLSLEPLPAAMETEFAALQLFKTADSPDPLIARTKRTQTGSRVIKHGGKWRLTSAEIAHSYVLRLYNAGLRIAFRLGQDQCWRENASLGFLINGTCMHALFDEIAARRYTILEQAKAFESGDIKEPSTKRIYVQGDVNCLETVLGLFSRYTGYLYANPPKTVAVPGLISQQWVESAQNNWRATIQNGAEQLRNIAENFRVAVAKIRDPWLPIMPILEMERPLQPIFDALNGMDDDRPSPFGSLVAMARHDQNHFLLRLLVHSKLRRAHFGRLSWKPDNSGHLRWDVGTRVWLLVIPQSEMKNEGSGALPAGGADLVLELDPQDRRLYRAIERWLGKVEPETGRVDEIGSSRRTLHQDAHHDWLFPGKRKLLSQRLERGLSDHMISTIVCGWSAVYLVARPWSCHGVEGVYPFAPHAIRDIVATHVLKTTGNLDDAARALFDTPENLTKHYAKFASREKSQRTNQQIGATVVY